MLLICTYQEPTILDYEAFLAALSDLSKSGFKILKGTKYTDLVLALLTPFHLTRVRHP